jgi:hypothetical protein
MATMAKPIELVTTLEGEDARWFQDQLEHPRPNRALEKTIEEARSIKID